MNWSTEQEYYQLHINLCIQIKSEREQARLLNPSMEEVFDRLNNREHAITILRNETVFYHNIHLTSRIPILPNLNSFHLDILNRQP
jgi:hypothetical protein